MAIEHLNPDGLARNPAFSQAIAVSGPHKTIYIGGQDAVDGKTGQIVGKSDLRAQTQQVFHNLRIALEAAGAGLQHIVKWTIYLVHGQDARAAFQIAQQTWGTQSNPPTISVLFVAGLAHPDFLIEIDAIAVVPETTDPP
jgi:enamine deaminase RidA (YjgF/YER057c/UK114 family)